MICIGNVFKLTGLTFRLRFKSQIRIATCHVVVFGQSNFAQELVYSMEVLYQVVAFVSGLVARKQVSQFALAFLHEFETEI